MEGQEPWPCPSPAIKNTSSSDFLLRDVSNFKTPRRGPSENTRFQSPRPHFFTASKQSPSSISSSIRRHHPSPAPSSTRSNATARRLKAFEQEQPQSSRKIQIRKDRSLRCLAKSLTAWLNFLFENPKSCGCNPLSSDGGEMETIVSIKSKGKRDSWPVNEIGVDLEWRNPKRHRDFSWTADGLESPSLPTSMFLRLKTSLCDICSFDDLKQRMGCYPSLGNCKDIFKMIGQVTKSIDDGRLKMRAHCPIVTDVGMRKKAIRILMCYNPIWLRVGLYIIFGSDFLLPNGDVNSKQEVDFLEMIIDKQFFSHAGIAKDYAYNKFVDGLYRAGYFERLGNIILKRFFLLVLILDLAKSHSSLPIEYGIDGIDGGSPLLFTLQSNIKSSRQMLSEFLSSDVMHGEGNLVSHLVILGYKVSYEQGLLIEYQFKITDLFQDLRDGVRLCRAIQILQHDSSIIMKTVVPLNNSKKSLSNCATALQYLKQAGVPLHDEDGMDILAEDLVDGDKELTLSLLWNIFVHLQLPLLIDRNILNEEIQKIRPLDVIVPKIGLSTHSEMLLIWIQAICKRYDIEVDNFASLVDGKAMWCLLDYYFRKEFNCSCSYNKDVDNLRKKGSIVLDTNDTDVVQSFILSQKLMKLFGNFPEVFQTSDILEYNCASSDQSVFILFVFLSSQLVVKRNMDHLNFHKLLGCECQSTEVKPSVEMLTITSIPAPNQDETSELISRDAATLRNFKAIQAWWQDMADRNCKFQRKTFSSVLCPSSNSNYTDIQEIAATIIQSYYRSLSERQNYLKIKNAVSFLQIVIRSWLNVKVFSAFKNIGTDRVQMLSCVFRRYIMFVIDRHNFLKLRRSVLHIQRAVRKWIRHRPSHHAPLIQNDSLVIKDTNLTDLHIKATVQKQLELLTHQSSSAIKIQCVFRGWLQRTMFVNQKCAALKIQCVFRGWLQRIIFVNQKRAALMIKTKFRCFIHRRDFRKITSLTKSAITIQSNTRGWIARREIYRLRRVAVQKQLELLIHQSLSAIKIQCIFRGWLQRTSFVNQKCAALKIQCVFRGWLQRIIFVNQKCAALKIQCVFHGSLQRIIFVNQKFAALKIQTKFRSFMCRRDFRKYTILTKAAIIIQSITRAWIARREIFRLRHVAVVIQRWWKGVMLLNTKTKAAIFIQSRFRRWNDRQKENREKQSIIMIQSIWRGYMARKESTRHLSELRLRVKTSATNVDDDRRIINRLLVALSELQSNKSIRIILHTCATLDMATKYSQKCCEELVAAGAIDNLLKLIRSLGRSVPDQVVAEHALSTLRNLARYPQLVEVLIDSHESIEIIFLELLRNKQEGFFIAAELLKRICAADKGLIGVKHSVSHIKSLQKLIRTLASKFKNQRRNASGLQAKLQIERKLKEASELLSIIIKSR